MITNLLFYGVKTIRYAKLVPIPPKTLSNENIPASTEEIF